MDEITYHRIFDDDGVKRLDNGLNQCMICGGEDVKVLKTKKKKKLAYYVKCGTLHRVSNDVHTYCTARECGTRTESYYTKEEAMAAWNCE
jgi:uncharacterized Zn finger protein